MKKTAQDLRHHFTRKSNKVIRGNHVFSLTLIISLFSIAHSFATVPLQLFVDLTPEGKTLRPIPGVYSGPLVIKKPIILDGMGEVTIDGQGKGTVITVLAGGQGSEIRNLRITNSGQRHNHVDAAILIETDRVIFEDNILEHVLFGVHISKGDHNIIRRNTISSLVDWEIVLRGEGIRLWYSQHNTLRDNHLFKVRDVVLANSPHNKVVGNHMTEGRIGIELIYSPGVEVAENIFNGNEHGVVGIYSDNLYIHHNRIEHQDKYNGSALAVKGSSQTRMEYNEILDCSIGLVANSPVFPENILYLIGNKFAYNSVAMFFYGDRGGHVIHDNHFVGNFQQVAVTSATSVIDNDWLGNYWQDYTGFDRDGDGIGDRPYCIFLYSDRIWMDFSMARFFRGSPMLEAVDFIERLIPFSDPDMILMDPKPRMSP